MGDNRDRSGDSRVLNHIGYVPKEGLIGRAEFIFFSSESAIWKIWNWPFDLRLDRFFNKLRPTTHE
jgi:signal peptidase I